MNEQDVVDAKLTLDETSIQKKDWSTKSDRYLVIQEPPQNSIFFLFESE
jgi:hypothetical protein